MKIDCQWLNANLEAFFCETLGADELRQASEHLNTCENCRTEVQSLRDVDPLIKQLMEFRMAQVQAAVETPRRGFVLNPVRLGLAGIGLALAATLGFAVFLHQTRSPEVNLPLAQPAVPGVESTATKTDNGSAPTLRAKPDAPSQVSSAAPVVTEPVIPEDAPEFSVMDPAGYSTNLQDYRGRVVLLGVWSADQPEATQNLQRLYQEFGTRKEVRMLGASSRKQERPTGTTFPMVFNNGSKLLEARNADYVIIDKEGQVQMRGSLGGDPNVLISKIRKKLDQLGGR